MVGWITKTILNHLLYTRNTSHWQRQTLAYGEMMEKNFQECGKSSHVDGLAELILWKWLYHQK
jgi:hypothetical protein